MPRAFITGLTGQDGSYLSEHLLASGYEVYGLIRGQNNPKRQHIERTLPDVHIVEGDLLECPAPSLLRSLIRPGRDCHERILHLMVALRDSNPGQSPQLRWRSTSTSKAKAG